mgnify:CR=1 FL=1
MRDIKLCHPRLQILAGDLISECKAQGLSIKIGETLRTWQNKMLYMLRAGQNQEILLPMLQGIVIVPITNGGLLSISFGMMAKVHTMIMMDFHKSGKNRREVRFRMGCNWRSPVDKPHFQLPDWGSSTSGIKKQYPNPDAFMRTWETELPIGWVNTPKGWWYHVGDGTYPANKWEVINHHWYLFNSDGYMCTSWHRWNGMECDPADGSGDWYYFTPDGPLEGACWHTRDNGAQEIWYVE